MSTAECYLATLGGARPAPTPTAVEPPGSIEIRVGTASVRIRGAVDGKTLTAVLKALKVLA